MTLAQLRVFLAVARIGHVTRAARQLGMTQSAASSAIAALEARHRIKLFDRVGRSIRLTAAGRAFLPEAKAVLDRAEAAGRVLQDLSNLAVGELTIGASQTIANYWLPHRLAQFHERHPGIGLNVVIGNTAQVERAVVDGAADIGFVEGQAQAAELRIDLVDHDRIGLVVAAGAWPAFGRGPGPLDLTAIPWVVRERGSGTRAVLEDLAAARGLAWEDLDIVLELPSNEAVREAVEAGAGATLISRHVVHSSVDNGTLRAVPIEVPPRDYVMLRHRQRHASGGQQALVAMLLGEARAAA